ncbi:F-box protein SKIP14-like [Rutidosis leptorrhynchoides]|uniref:F-box protein SKIP14-like n=1 Tax=Rutidosis leptorrhynchoides TaxID=125765 RepID=UPI003A9949BB
MGDDVMCDAKVSSSDYKDMKFDGCYKDYMKLNWKLIDDVSDLLPSDPFEMNYDGGGCKIEIKIDDTNGLFLFDGKSKNFLNLVNNDHNVNCANDDDDDDDNNDDDGAPHDAMFYALGYLETMDLLSVEEVCRSLRDGVRNDPLLWRNIHIDPPFGELFGDNSLLKITNRANGSLQSLSLLDCRNITDIGLENVFKTNPLLTKLCIAGCDGLSMEGLINNMKFLKSLNGSGIKRLRIGGIYSIKSDQYEEIKKLLSINQQQQQPNSFKPRFYNGDNLYLSLDNDRPIDVESCPKCRYLRQIYDCPLENCTERCRACTFCIPRCISCGCCFRERDYMETFCLELLCMECLTQILSFQDEEDEEEEEEESVSCGSHQQATYHFRFYG